VKPETQGCRLGEGGWWSGCFEGEGANGLGIARGARAAVLKPVTVDGGAKRKCSRKGARRNSGYW